MKKIFLFLMNNMLTNQFLIAIGKDGIIKKYVSNWSKTTLDSEKSLQENVGFSHDEEVQQAIDKVHGSVQEAYQKQCKSIGAVMDIGCGVGLYLQDFPQETPLAGTDLSDEFILKGQELLPNANLTSGDFMEMKISDRFAMVFSISVLEYIPPSKLKSFFNKIASHLAPDGIILIQYPHALSKRQLYYPDLSYVQYSPQKIEKVLVKSGFQIVSHKHSYDDRDLNFTFDSKRYDPEKDKSFRNGAIIIGRVN